MKNKNLKYCILNEALSPSRFLRLGPFSGESTLQDIRSILKLAENETKLNDFGDTSFVNHYTVVMNSPEQLRDKYSNLGYIMSRGNLIDIFKLRLNLTKYLADNLEVKNVPVRNPVFVMGLHRTGTTYLHRLLSLDPAVRAPFLWEMV